MSGTLIGLRHFESKRPPWRRAERLSWHDHRCWMRNCVLGARMSLLWLAQEHLLTGWRGIRARRRATASIVAIANGPLFVATLVAILACEASPLVVHSWKTPPPAELRRYARRFGAARFLAGRAGRCEAGCPGDRDHYGSCTMFADALPLDWSTFVRSEIRHAVGPRAAGRSTSSDFGLDRLAQNRAASRPGGDGRSPALCRDDGDRCRDDVVFAIPANESRLWLRLRAAGWCCC